MGKNKISLHEGAVRMTIVATILWLLGYAALIYEAATRTSIPAKAPSSAAWIVVLAYAGITMLAWVLVICVRRSVISVACAGISVVAMIAILLGAFPDHSGTAGDRANLAGTIISGGFTVVATAGLLLWQAFGSKESLD